MAKKKKAKLKIPKEIAGVKLPKEVRKKAKVAIALAENPMVRDLVAAGLTAAAAALIRKDEDAAPGAAAKGDPQSEEARKQKSRRKREALVAVAKDVALGVAAAYAEETRKKGKQNGSRAETPEPAAS